MAVLLNSGAMNEHFLESSEKSSGNCGAAKPSIAGHTSNQSDFEAIAVSAKQATFRVLYALCPPANRAEGKLWMMENIIIWLQALSFPLSDSAVLLWEPTMIYKFTWILSLVCLRSLGDGTVAEAAFFVALALIIGQLSLFAWVALALHQEGPTPSWQIKILRASTRLTSGVLFIPIVTNALRPLDCAHAWLHSGWACYQNAHLALVIISICLLAAFVPLTLLVTASLCDRDPKSESLAAKPHGRVTAFIQALHFLLALGFALGSTLHSTLLVVLATCVGVLMLYALLMFQPFYRVQVNLFHATMAFVYLWACINVCLLQIRRLPKANVESYSLLLGWPSFAYAGYGIAKMLWERIGASSDIGSTVLQVELSTRYDLITKRTHQSPSTEEERQAEAALFSEVEESFAQGMSTHHNSALLHLFIAQYIRTYRGNRHVEMLHVACAECSSPAIDVEFFLYHRRMEIREDERQSSAMSVLTRVRFEELGLRRDEFCIRSREMQHAFWSELMKSNPSVAELNRLAELIRENMQSCEDCFAKQLALNPNSFQTLQRYSRFLIEVRNNVTKAMRIEQQAVELEDALSKEHNDAGAVIQLFQQRPALDAAREDVGVITISQSAASLGVVTSANAMALRLFGFTKRDIIGQNINTIIPEPIASVHQQYLNVYIRTGREVMMKSSRTMFGKHHQGYLFPILMNANAMENGFAGVIQKLPCEDEFIWFYSTSFIVCGASQGSFQLLGVNGSEIDEGSVLLTRYVSKEKLVAMMESDDKTTSGGKKQVKSATHRFEMENVSADFISSRLGSAFDPQEVRKVDVVGRAQITPFLRSGWLVGHQPKSEVTEGDGSGGERLVVLSWKRQKAGGRRDSLTQSHLIVSAMSDPCMGASSSCFEAPLASDGAVAQKAIQAGRSLRAKRGSVSESLAALLENGESEERECVDDDSQSPRSDSAGEAHDEVGYDDLPVPASALPFTTGSTEFTDLNTTALPASRSASLRSAMKGIEPRKQSSGGVLTLNVLASDPASDVDPAAFKGRGTAKVLPVESNTDGRSESQSSTGSRSTMSTFHSAIESDRHTEEPSLVLLKKLLYIVAIFVVMITLATMIISRSVISGGVTSASTLREGGDRLIEQQEVSFWSAMLGVAAGGYSSRLTFAATNAQFTSNLESFIAIHYDMLVNHPPSSVAMANFVYNQLFTTPRLHDNVITFVNQTLVDLAAEYIAAGNEAIYLSAANVSSGNNEYIFELIQSSPVLYNCFNHTNVLRYHSAISALDADNNLTYLNIGAIVFLAIPIFIILLPTAVMIEREKHRIFELFMNVPVSVAKRLSSVIQRRMDAIRRDLESQNENNEEDLADIAAEEESFDWKQINFANFIPRKLSSNYWSGLFLWLKLSLPLLGCLLYVYLISRYSSSVKQSLVYDHSAMFLSEQRTAHATATLFNTVQAVTATDESVAAAFATTATSELSALVALEETLFLDPSSWGFSSDVNTGAVERTLMLSNGCLGSSNTTECGLVANSLFSRGLNAVVQSFASTARTVLNSRVQNATGSTVQSRLADPSWRELEYVGFYMIEGLRYADSLRQQSILSRGDSFSKDIGTAEACLVVGLLLCFTFLYLPTIRRLNIVLKTARATLLLFPNEVVNAIPQVHTLMREYARKAHRTAK